MEKSDPDSMQPSEGGRDTINKSIENQRVGQSDVSQSGQQQAGVTQNGGSDTNYQNVGDKERIGSGILGTGLVYRGLRRGGVGGLIMGSLGSAMMYRGLSGHCGLYEKLGINSK